MAVELADNLVQVGFCKSCELLDDSGLNFIRQDYNIPEPQRLLQKYCQSTVRMNFALIYSLRERGWCSVLWFLRPVAEALNNLTSKLRPFAA